MGFLKVVKNKAYYKRFQVAKRRRREGKTDFMARNAMCKQDKNKYNAPKYRLVVRHTNRKCIVQICYATIAGDKVVCQALSTELPRYGIKAGLTNYAATYATGLLCGRRLLKQLELEDAFEGVEEADGEEYHIEEELEDEDRRPFKAILDIGLVRTTVGAKVFAAMKGAADAGLHIPHSINNFPGYEPPEERGMEPEFNAEALADRILGRHVAEYMETMQEEDEQKYEAHFAKFIAGGVGPDDMEDMYKDAHKAIREDPSFTKREKRTYNIVQRGNVVNDGAKDYPRSIKKSKSERKATVATKIQVYAAKMLAGMEEEEEE